MFNHIQSEHLSCTYFSNYKQYCNKHLCTYFPVHLCKYFCRTDLRIEFLNHRVSSFNILVNAVKLPPKILPQLYNRCPSPLHFPQYFVSPIFLYFASPVGEKYVFICILWLLMKLSTFFIGFLYLL